MSLESIKLTKEERRNLSTLVTREEVESVYRRYAETFLHRDDEQEEDETEVEARNHSFREEEMSRHANDALGTDLGVYPERTYSWGKLMQRLGLNKNDKVLPFMNAVRNRDSVFVWSEHMKPEEARQKQMEMNAKRAELEANPSASSEWLPLTLLWHQMVGITSIIRRMTTMKTRSGILIADEVGVGKTSVTLGTIAMLTHMYELVANQKEAAGHFGE